MFEEVARRNSSKKPVLGPGYTAFCCTSSAPLHSVLHTDPHQYMYVYVYAYVYRYIHIIEESYLPPLVVAPDNLRSLVVVLLGAAETDDLHNIAGRKHIYNAIALQIEG